MVLKKGHFYIIHELSQLSRRLRFELIMEPAVASQDASKSNNTRTYVGIIIHVENISRYSTKLGESIPTKEFALPIRMHAPVLRAQDETKEDARRSVDLATRERERTPFKAATRCTRQYPIQEKKAISVRANPAHKTTSFLPSLPSPPANPSSQDKIPKSPRRSSPIAPPNRRFRRGRGLSHPSTRIAGSVLSRRPFLLWIFSSFFFLLPLFLRRRLLGERKPLHLLAELACGRNLVLEFFASRTIQP
jgi:hypothetical protein